MGQIKPSHNKEGEAMMIEGFPKDVQVISPADLDEGESGGGASGAMSRASALGLGENLWVGMSFTPHESRTSLHHHGNQLTIVYVVAGLCKVVAIRGSDVRSMLVFRATL